MTPIPYRLKAYRSTQDNRFYGELFYGQNAVAQAKENDLPGFKDFKGLEEWARLAAVEHKLSVTPAETHVIERSFTV